MRRAVKLPSPPRPPQNWGPHGRRDPPQLLWALHRAGTHRASTQAWGRHHPISRPQDPGRILCTEKLHFFPPPQRATEMKEPKANPEHPGWSIRSHRGTISLYPGPFWPWLSSRQA